MLEDERDETASTTNQTLKTVLVYVDKGENTGERRAARDQSSESTDYHILFFSEKPIDSLGSVQRNRSGWTNTPPKGENVSTGRFWGLQSHSSESADHKEDSNMIETLLTGIAIGFFAAAIFFDLIIMGSIIKEIIHHD